MMDRIFDLPAHPLVVHFPVVAIPVLALLTLGIALSPTIRRKYGHFTVALGVVTAVSTFLATMSGDSLVADSEEFKGLPAFLFDDHKALGEQTRLMVFGLLAGPTPPDVCGPSHRHFRASPTAQRQSLWCWPSRQPSGLCERATPAPNPTGVASTRQKKPRPNRAPAFRADLANITGVSANIRCSNRQRLSLQPFTVPESCRYRRLGFID